MTDKKQDDQNMDAELKSISDAFKRLNQADDLQPSKELDAIILQQAADAVEASKQSSTNESGSDYDDLTFRRNRIIAAEERMRKKSFLPIWAMPMGLAATILLSFGVVTKVLLSPEFQEIGMQSTSEPVYDDSMIVTGENTGVKQKVKVLTAEEEQEKNKEVTFEALRKLQKEHDLVLTHPDLAREGFDKTIANEQWLNYIDNELEQKEELAKKKSDYVPGPQAIQIKPEVVVNSVKRARSENPNAAVVLNSEQTNSAGFSVGEIATAEEELRQNSKARRKDAEEILMAKRSIEQAVSAPAIEPSSPEIPATYEIDIQAMSSTDADISYAPEKQATAEQTFAEPIVPEPIVIEEKAASVIAPEVGTLSSDSVQEVSVTASRVNTDSDLNEDEFSEGELESTLSDSVEEIVVTNALILDSPETETQGLTEVIFEHRQCQVSYDCALVALECDSCDCLETVNLSNLDKYDSEFSVTEIKEQCLNQNAECVLGYCQAREIEGLSE